MVSLRRLRSPLFVRLAILLLVSVIPALPPQALAPAEAHAAATSRGSFGSAVPCMTGADTFAITCFADTLFTYLSAAQLSNRALATFTESARGPALATLGQLGAVYGLAYDDGMASGVRRLLVAAYAKRYSAFGALGPGGIYEVRLSAANAPLAVLPWLTIPNASACGVADCHQKTSNSDYPMAAQVGKTSLGDMEIGPSGKTLYVTNLATKSIARVSLGAGGSGVIQSSLTPNLALISSSGVVQADLRPFGLEFQPGTNLLYVGIVDSAERAGAATPPSVYPNAYVLSIDVTSGVQSLVLSQPLCPSCFGTTRHANSTQAGKVDWNPWGASITGWGQAPVFRPQPLVSDIQFSRSGQMLFLGFRDRTGDQFLGARAPANNPVAQAQGDILAYRKSGAAWALQSAAATISSDYLNDNYVGDAADGDTVGTFPNHAENAQGALAGFMIDRAGGNGFGGLDFRLASTTITPLRGMTSGANFYTYSPYQRTRVGRLELIAPSEPGDGKSAGLGDLEILCDNALIGDRVWQDVNANGLQDAGESGTAGVVVELLDAAGQLLTSATTDASGAYTFAIEPGTTYTLRLAASNFATPSNPLYDMFLARQNQGTDDTLDSDADEIDGTIAIPAQNRDGIDTSFDFGLIRHPQLDGVVGDRLWNDSNANGQQDAGEPNVTVGGGQMVASASVQLLGCVGNSPACASTTTVQTVALPQAGQPPGQYLFQLVPPGYYRVRFMLPSGTQATILRAAGVPGSLNSDASGSGIPAWTTDAFCLVSGANVARPTCSRTNRDQDLGLLVHADLRIVKTAPAAVPRGDALPYTLAWRNAGPGQAENVQVVDSLPIGVMLSSATPPWSSWNPATRQLVWNLGTQAPGAAGTITLNGTVDAAAPNLLLNTATIASTTSDPIPDDNFSTTTTQVQQPGVYITKSGPPTALVGDVLIYQLDYANLIRSQLGQTSEARNTSIVDTLPAGTSFVAATPWPSSISGQVLTWAIGTLTAGTSRSISVQARVATGFLGSTVTNQARIDTVAPPGDDPSDNQASVTTSILRPALSISISAPASITVGDPLPLTIGWANRGSSAAATTQIVVNVPIGVTPTSASPLWSSWNPLTRQLSWNLGTQVPGASGTISVQTVSDEAAAAMVTHQALITTSTPGELDTSDNLASASTAVLRPNVYVQLTAPAQSAYLSEFFLSVPYGNNGANPAATSILTLTLPSGLTFLFADTTPSSGSGQTRNWDLGTLAAGARGSLRVGVKVEHGAGGTLTSVASISTSTHGDDPADNTAQATTLILPPPPPASSQASDLRLAIHSDLDPNSQDNDPRNGVYRSSTQRIAWPAGEVLDFTPRLSPLARGVNSGPYFFTAEALGWSLVSHTVDGTTYAAAAADSMHNQRGHTGSGCRPRTASTNDISGLVGCAYRYIGGTSLTDTTEPTEADMAGQAHAYWTVILPQSMRDDVAVYRMRQVKAVAFDVMTKVAVTRWANATVVHPDGSISTEQRRLDTTDQFTSARFTAEMVVPRSVK